MSREKLSLSDDAKGFAGCLWSSPIGTMTELVFHMVESRPTARAQAALEELVAAGFLLQEVRMPGEKTTYRPTESMARFKRFKKLGRFPLTEPIVVKDKPR